jgi:hypothetical protein
LADNTSGIRRPGAAFRQGEGQSQLRRRTVTNRPRGITFWP